MSYTSTQALSKTYSEAKARYVMGKVKEDLLGLMNSSIINIDRVNSIYNDVLYLLNNEVLIFFELQFKKGNGHTIGGIHYKVEDTGSIYTDEESGGIDFWDLPENTKVTLLVQLDSSAPNYERVNSELNWGYGSALSGTQEHLKNYSKDGYGLSQNKIGNW